MKLNKSDLSVVTVILRGYDYEQIKTVIEAMKYTKLRTVEITTNSPNAFESIRLLTEEYEDFQIGVGTILTKEDAENSVKAGAKFVLSPTILSEDIVKYLKENKIMTIIGAYTPSEVYKMFSYGADIVKIFPASEMTDNYVKALQGPLGKLDLMAVGGVNKENAREYLSQGYKYLGIGSGIFNKDDIKNKNLEKLKESIIEFERILEE